MVHEGSFIEVVAGGVPLGRAYPQDALSNAQRKDILTSRTASMKRAKKLLHQEAQRRKARFAAATVTQPNPEVVIAANVDIDFATELDVAHGRARQESTQAEEAVRRLLDAAGGSA